MTQPGMRVRLIAAIAVVVWVGACSDSPISVPPASLATGLIASNPILGTLPASGSAPGPSLSAGDGTVYVTLLPGTVLGGGNAEIHVVGRIDTVFATVSGGGFDPVPIPATVGDSIEVVVTDAGGAPVQRMQLTVAAVRPPILVRTEPPPRKRDQPLNAALVVVFSEPVAGSSLTASSMQVLRGSTPVAGSVSLLQGTGSAAAFVPDVPLSANTDYRLVVTRAVKDLQGDALQAEVTVPFTTGQSSTGPAASITLSPDTVFMSGATYQMTATVRDAAGNQLIDQPVTWSTSDPAGVTVSATGLLTALAGGFYKVTATVDGLSAESQVYITAGPAASVTVSPTQSSVGAAGDTIKLTAIVRDAAGRLLFRPSVTWTSSDVAVGTVATDSVGNTGLAFATVTGVSLGSVTITATSGTASGTASVTVVPPPPVASVTVTPASATLVPQGTMQLSATVRAANGKVLAGRPITWTSDNAAVATVSTSGLVTGVSVGSAVVTATSEGVSDSAGISVVLLAFSSVTTGEFHVCGLTTVHTAWCWGHNNKGQLGNGTTTGFDTTKFTLVTGGLTFAAVSAGFYHTCGVTTGGAAYCWGANDFGQLGDGSTVSSAVPVAVSGGHAFVAISAGGGYWSGVEHTCAVTATGAAYCWGANNGQLGNGSTVSSSVPVAVSGALTFAAVSAGGAHTCGVTTTGAAYCWGSNDRGQLGNGSTVSNSVPVAVTGGRTFSAIDAGGLDYAGHSCALTTGGSAYCWGANDFGQLGDGSTVSSSVPVAMTGGLAFSVVSAGGSAESHTCGVTTGGAAYCWGNSGYDTATEVPVLVPGGLSFAIVSAGGGGSCGVTVDNIAYCWSNIGDVPVKVAGQP